MQLTMQDQQDQFNQMESQDIAKNTKPEGDYPMGASHHDIMTKGTEVNLMSGANARADLFQFQSAINLSGAPPQKPRNDMTRFSHAEHALASNFANIR